MSNSINPNRSTSPLSNSVFSTTSTNALHPRSALGYRFSTLCTTVDNPDADHKDRHGSSSVPIYQTATFKGMGGAYDYSRSGNPSRTFLEHHIAKISSAKHAFAVTSGMGALDIIFRTLKPGDEIIAGNDLYGGSNRLLTYLREHGGIITHHLDTTQADSLRPFLVPDSKIRMVLLESPTNPLLQIADIEQISTEVKSVIPEALIVVDNTMMSPYLMRPLEFGADIVYDSGTKYLSGHHDLMAGLVICNSDSIARSLGFVINSIGNGLAPFDCFLLLRGVKTLAIRLDRQQETAIKVADYLHNLGFKVNYPGLANHPGKEIHDRLAKGPGAVLSFETGDKSLSEKIVSSARLWGISVSFGCVNSLISMPCLMSHASIDPAVRAARNLPEDLIRLCVGIEDCDDLLEDLEAALIEARAIRIVDETTIGSGFERIVVRRDSDASTPQITDSEQDDPVIAAQESRRRLSPTTLLVSAPGKIILFGEHSVVYGKRALAAAVGLRCYCLIEPSKDQSVVQLVLPDSKFVGSWTLDELPWPSTTGSVSGKDELKVDESLSKKLLDLVTQQVDKPTLVEACHAFLYLYVHLAANSSTRRAQVYTIRSALPIGAGLGSSASYSVSLSTGLLYTHAHLPLSQMTNIELDQAETINRWAFLGEKILHGNPSGVDNTVSTYGGAIGFRKAIRADETAVQDRLKSFRALDFLVTDTRVGRDTKGLVKLVRQRKEEEPDFVQAILDRLEELTQEAERISTSDQVEDGRLGEMMGEAHKLLGSLGVGHLDLDRICQVGERMGLRSKMTGAGGGGCAITLLPNGFSKTDKLVEELEKIGFSAYRTRVGGEGVGIKVDLSDQDLEVMKTKKSGGSVFESGGLESKSDEWCFCGSV